MESNVDKPHVSANAAETATTAGAGAKRPFPTKSNPNNKRPRFTKPGSNPAFLKSNAPSSLMTTPRQNIYEINIATKYFLDTVEITYSVMSDRDYRLDKQLTLADLQYVSLCALLYRVHAVRSLSGKFCVQSFGKLKECVENLVLPDFIAKAIESIGIVALPNGTCVLPKELTNTSVKEASYHVHPYTLIVEGDRHPPGTGLYGDLSARQSTALTVTDTSLYYDKAACTWIFTRYMSRIARGIKTGVLFRKVDFTKVEGTVEYTVMRKVVENLTCVGLATHSIPDSQAKLGAIYGFRNDADHPTWVTEDDEKHVSYVHTSKTFALDVETVAHISNSMR